MKPRLMSVSLFCLVVLGAWITVVPAQDSMSDFGLNVTDLENRVVDALVKGYVPASPDKKVFKSAPAPAQAAFVRNTLNWLKAYTESDAFRTGYAEQRAAARPAAPAAMTADEKYAAFLAEQRASLEKTRREVAQLPPDIQQQMQGVLEQMAAEIEKNAKDQNMAASIKQGYADENVMEQQNYQEQLTAWEKEYPEDPRVMLAARLRQFMTVSAEVAFEAEVAPDAQGNTMKFVDPRYEAQTKTWKLCYRAGREPVQAARAFVAEWLDQIEKR